jgi:hypothetical protein
MRHAITGFLAICLAGSVEFSLPRGQDDLAIWKEFVAAVRSGTLAPDKIRPLYGVPKETLLAHLRELKVACDSNASWSDWDSPEVFPVGNLVHFIVRIPIGPGTTTDRCFSFTKEGDSWYYGHMEGIFIRLDKTPPPPTSDFPDVDAATKAWQREEVYWSEVVQNYLTIAKKNGQAFALDLLKSGPGYFVAAKSWVPFLPPQRAFILYLCWEQSRLRENLVVLEKLTEEEAVVSLQAYFFFLYKRATHLRQWIPFDEYKQIFETIWQDRALAAGWNLAIECQDPECLHIVLHFTRKNSAPASPRPAREPA